MDNAYAAGQKFLCGDYTQYTPAGKSHFVKAGRFDAKPLVGDIVYFYSRSMGRVSHVGAVIEVKKQGNRYYIKTIEGNTSSGAGFNRNGGEVAIKEYEFSQEEVGGKNRIDGFGHPLYGMQTCTLQDFLSVLKEEVGYIEKASDKDLYDKTANRGDRNFTKYGAWYKNNGVYWCQQFISWCAYMACRKSKEAAESKWIKSDGTWKYLLYGELVKGQWLIISDRWYVFDKSGTMITGWFKSGDDWYYLNPADGAMISGQWVQVDNKWFYITKSGVMARSAYVEDKGGYCFMGADGVWDGVYLPRPDNDFELVE